MAGIELEKGKVIHSVGEPITELHLITKGKVQVNYPGGKYILEKGECLGICEICSEVHFLSYQTLTDTTVLSFPLTSMESLNDLLQKQMNIAGLFILSAFHQITTLFNHCDISELNCSNLYNELTNDYHTYQNFCNRYGIAPRQLEGFEDCGTYLAEETADLWLSAYYMGLQRLFNSGHVKAYIQDPAISLGTLRKVSLDFRRTCTVLEEQYQYRYSLRKFYFNESRNDLFDFMTSLYYKLGKDSPDITNLYNSIYHIIVSFQKTVCVDAAYHTFIKEREEEFLQNAASITSPSKQTENSEKDTSYLTELADSLNTILDFAGSEMKEADTFRKHIRSYKELEDKSSTEDSANLLRRKITNEFYDLYTILFRKSLKQPNLPVPVRMFLYFGYVDEELAGSEACSYLYSLSKNISDKGESGVYTFYSWLLAIYHGEKEPSRNEFDQDYSDYIHKQKASGAITDIEMKDLEKDTMAKVIYELQNLFPSANKVTYGRIATFCPVFSADNCLKELSSCYVTASAVSEILDNIKKIDYSVFYRETMDIENMNVVGREPIHVEYLPDVILMPNVGIRGIMWQEIEGKRRTSPSRMIFSIFHMEDLATSFIRTTGEYRWEMCKRIQGGHWNDLSELSLTSEYFDYIQFYRKNRELSNEAKERVKQSLQRAKNSFKEMFVRDYLVWILYEGTGSPRLNKVSRSILFTYCPFSAKVCELVEQNPLYTELLHKYRLHTAQSLHKLDVLTQKIQNSGRAVPETLENERRFLNS